jgi:hypothetical protein
MENNYIIGGVVGAIANLGVAQYYYKDFLRESGDSDIASFINVPLLATGFAGGSLGVLLANMYYANSAPSPLMLALFAVGSLPV